MELVHTVHGAHDRPVEARVSRARAHDESTKDELDASRGEEGRARISCPSQAESNGALVLGLESVLWSRVEMLHGCLVDVILRGRGGGQWRIWRVQWRLRGAHGDRRGMWEMLSRTVVLAYNEPSCPTEPLMLPARINAALLPYCRAAATQH